ncbi:hypothetical protein ACSSNL_04405 [Thalassobius sp. S69A]|uniref:hypothetical protein n=1 Tax=unclassified Thalassovita TaxID=2619711 RepID=UPI003C7EB5A5
MSFKDSLWDDSDPAYSPCLSRIRGTYYWVPPKKYRDAGYSIKTYRLGGQEGDGLHLDRARACREMTRSMVNWYEGNVERQEPGTWGWLITRYMTDEYSAIHDVRASTREGYKKVMTRIANGIGDVPIDDTDFPRMMEWKRTMEANGRSVHYISRWFNHFSILLSHGSKIGIKHCRELRAVKSDMRIKSPPKRQKFITREQVEKIVARLDADGFGYVSLSLLFRFEFMLRGVDVYGDWAPSDGKEGGIVDGGRVWEGGLTWEMFEPDLSSFEKVISKTRDGLTEPYHFNLSDVPEIVRRLSLTPPDKRVGPVICLPGSSKPPKNGIVSRRFKAALRDCKLPDDLRISDARSGGITEAKSLVDPYQLRDAAQHTQITTTDRYVRSRSEAANNVVKLRQVGRK